MKKLVHRSLTFKTKTFNRAIRIDTFDLRNPADKYYSSIKNISKHSNYSELPETVLRVAYNLKSKAYKIEEYSFGYTAVYANYRYIEVPYGLLLAPFIPSHAMKKDMTLLTSSVAIGKASPNAEPFPDASDYTNNQWELFLV